MTIVNTNIAETINIGQNGTYDVARYATANVNVDVTPKLAIQFSKDANGKVLQPNTIIDLDGATDVDKYALEYAYYNNTNITGAVDLSSLTAISGYNACEKMFSNCTGLTSINLSSLKTIGSYGCPNMFSECVGITSVDLSSLESATGKNACYYMFSGCTGLTSVGLSNLKYISGNYACQGMFNGCTSLVSVNLSGVRDIHNGGCWNMFSGCTSLTSLSFPALKNIYNANVFQNMLSGVTGCTVHFPSNLSSYAFNCGGTNTTVLYDLPATA